MKKLRQLAAILLFVGVVSTDSSAFHGWKPGKELTYKFETEDLSGIPDIRNQFSGLKLISDVIVQTYRDYSLRIRLVNPKLRNVNQVLEMKAGRPLVPLPNDPVPDALRRPLMTPFEAHLRRGVIESVFVEQSEPVLVTNIKKAILSQLQLDLSRSRGVREEGWGKPGPEIKTDSGELLPVFQVQESGVTGDCLTKYSVHPLADYEALELEDKWREDREILIEDGILAHEKTGGESECRGKQYYVVTKEKDLDDCIRSPRFSSIAGAENRCKKEEKEGCSKESLRKSSSRYILCGSPDEYVIRKVDTTSDVVTNPLFKSTEQMESLSRISLFLVKVKNSGISSLKKPQQPRKERSLIFDYPSETILSPHKKMKKAGYLVQPSVESAGSMLPKVMSLEELTNEVVDKMKQAVRLINSSPESCSSRQDITGVISEIIRGLRSAGLDDLKKIDKAVRAAFASAGEDKDVALEIFVDCLAGTGSNAGFMMVKQKIIEMSDIGLQKAIKVLRTAIKNIMTPTEGIIEEIYDLAKQLESSNVYLRNQALIMLANLVNKACINPIQSQRLYPVHLYGSFCSKNSEVIVQKIIPHIARQLEDKPDASDEQLANIAIMGELGHKDILPSLVRVIERSSVPMVRSLAVHSLKKLARREPALVRPVLMALVTNPAENDEVRIAAVATLPHADPTRSDWKTLAVLTWFEPSKQVSSFIYSTMKELSEGISEDQKSLREKLALIIDTVKPSREGIFLSQSYLSDTFVKYVGYLVQKRGDVVISESSRIPVRLSTATNLLVGNHEITELSLAIYAQGMDSLLGSAMSTGHLASNEAIDREMEKISRKLNIETRSSRLEPKGILTWDMFGAKNVVPLKTAVEDIVEKAIMILRHPEVLTRGKEFQATSSGPIMQMISVAPSETGLLWVEDRSIQSASGIKGKLQVQPMRGDIDVAIKVEAVPVLNWKFQKMAGVLSPFSKEISLSGMFISSHKSIGLKMDVKINRFGQLDLEIDTPKAANKEMEVLHLFLKPITGVKSLKDLKPITQGEIKVILSGAPELKKEIDLERSTGISAKIVAKADYSDVSPVALWEMLRDHSMESITQLFAITPSLKHASVSLVMNPEKSKMEKLKLSLTVLRGQTNDRGKSVHKNLLTSMEPLEVTPLSEVDTSCRENNVSPADIEKCKVKAKEGILKISEQEHEACTGKDHSEEEMKECRMMQRICEMSQEICMKSGKHSGPVCDGKKLKCAARRSLVMKIKDLAKNGKYNYGIGINLAAKAVLQDGREKGVEASLVDVSEDRKNLARRSVELEGKLLSSESQAPMSYVWTADSITRISDLPDSEDIQSALNHAISLKNEIKVKAGKSRDDLTELITLRSNWTKSGELKEELKKSSVMKQCLKDESERMPYSKSCTKARKAAASLDLIQVGIDLPNGAINTIEGVAQSMWMEQAASSLSDISSRRAKIQLRLPLSGRSLSVSLITPREGETILKNVNIPLYLQKMLPLSLATDSRGQGQLNSKMSTYPLCQVGKGQIRTLDSRRLHYSLAPSCQHLIIKDCSREQNLAVLAKEREHQKLELEVYAGSRKMALKVRGQDSEIEVQGKSIKLDHSKPQYDVLDGDDKLVMMVRREVVSGKPRLGVYIPAVEVKLSLTEATVGVSSGEHLRNKACGLCGDYNLEQQGDLLTPQKCILRKSKYFGYSYILDQECIPSRDREEYSHEVETCAKKEIKKTRLFPLLGLEMKSAIRSHVVQDQKYKICFSKHQVDMCKPRSAPSSTELVEVAFACLPKYSPKTSEIQEKIGQGKRIDELATMPTEFSSKVHQAVKCRS